MNVEKIARKALTIIKLRYGLPKSGFLAGGSISNLAWEIVSNNKSIINDIDIFEKIGELDPNSKNTFHISKLEEKKIIDNYNNLNVWYKGDKIYEICTSNTKGIFNFIGYRSNETPNKILESFDINAAQLGYSIEEDKIYYTKEFEEFLNDGKLRVTNLNSPSHTAIRILKKKKELNAHLDQFEIDILKYVIETYNSQFHVEKPKRRFKERYLKLLMSNSEVLNNFMVNKCNFSPFDKIFDSDAQAFDDMWELIPRQPSNLSIPKNITTYKKLLFYIRNIYNNKDLEEKYATLEHIWCDDYIDTIDITKKEIDYISKLSKRYPSITLNLTGLTLSLQLRFIKKVIEKINIFYDVETAISILESSKIYKDIKFEDDDYLILELSARKAIKDRKHDISFINEILEK